jgi:hypothetical protein
VHRQVTPHSLGANSRGSRMPATLPPVPPWETLAPTRNQGDRASTLVWILLAALYLTALVLGISTLRKGHIVLFCVGIFLPVLWVVGALIAPTPRVAAANARGALQ